MGCKKLRSVIIHLDNPVRSDRKADTVRYSPIRDPLASPRRVIDIQEHYLTQ